MAQELNNRRTHVQKTEKMSKHKHLLGISINFYRPEKIQLDARNREQTNRAVEEFMASLNISKSDWTFHL